ncbi:tRNA (guanosine(46)-N7)-methyltransferase TrmB [Frigoriglobus tundricola]|uniref:tRNA (guanine-N(7)-)-methyltransferase n=1 Tax=Frigoriglobus tundricola TaxID=2774151 RepID=A0A6M5YY25_9BACT|nr:tRNA (guanosine(46)-N7)-methyltransferase TrmB [Frigoriglobus tundricola]QJW98316.1 tRNA (guanine(46)-N(7))-methyltransferase [Frigoriglobus tundricola]
MRKPRRLSNEQLAPWVWALPAGRDRRTEAGAETQTDSAGPAPPVAVSAPPARIDWAALFGNANPVEIEVGTGKGLFLLHAATTRPGANFLGIEIVRKYQLYATTRYAIRNLPNVKTACADAAVVLRDYVAPGSVAAVHVYFPDPWWKKRHRKRRVFTPEFAADAARAIAFGGRLYIASDVEEYFLLMSAILRAMPCFAERPEEAERAAPQTETGYATNFERKARESGTAVWRAVYERTAEAVTVVPDPAE